MDFATVGIVVLGLVLGPLAFWAHSWIAHRLTRNNPDPALRTNRGQAQLILAEVAGLLALVGIMFVGLWTFDLYPLYSRAPLFFWSFFIGVVVFSLGIRLVRYARGLLHARGGDS
jgi:Na+/glutamate symporter